MNKKKFVINTVLLFIFIWIVMSLGVFVSQFNVADYSSSGFPLEYSWSGSECYPGYSCSGFYILNLIFDIVIWLIVSIGVSFLGNKLKSDASVMGVGVSKYNKLAVISFLIPIISIISIVAIIFISNSLGIFYIINNFFQLLLLVLVIFNLVGFVLGIISIFQIKKSGNKGAWLAIFANIIYIGFIMVIISEMV